MTFDYKKEYKEFYLPPRTPGIVTVPAMNFLALTSRPWNCSMPWPTPSK